MRYNKLFIPLLIFLIIIPVVVADLMTPFLTITMSLNFFINLGIVFVEALLFKWIMKKWFEKDVSYGYSLLMLFIVNMLSFIFGTIIGIFIPLYGEYLSLTEGVLTVVISYVITVGIETPLLSGFLRKEYKIGFWNILKVMILLNLISYIILAGIFLPQTMKKHEPDYYNSESVRTQIQQQILEDLRVSNKKISFPAARLTLEPRGEQTIMFGVKSIGIAREFYFDIYVAEDKTGYGCKREFTEPFDPALLQDKCEDQPLDFFYDPGPFTFGKEGAEVFVIDIKDEAREEKAYIVTINVYEANDDGRLLPEPYAQKNFFVEVV